MIWKALAVEVIRILWNEGLYVQNATLKQIHSNWFDCWVQWKTDETMKEVDHQIEETFLESAIEPPAFSEQKEGETTLGGKMRLRAPWLDEDAN